MLLKQAARMRVSVAVQTVKRRGSRRRSSTDGPRAPEMLNGKKSTKMIKQVSVEKFLEDSTNSNQPKTRTDATSPLEAGDAQWQASDGEEEDDGSSPEGEEDEEETEDSEEKDGSSPQRRPKKSTSTIVREFVKKHSHALTGDSFVADGEEEEMHLCASTREKVPVSVYVDIDESHHCKKKKPTVEGHSIRNVVRRGVIMC